MNLNDTVHGGLLFLLLIWRRRSGNVIWKAGHNLKWKYKLFSPALSGKLIANAMPFIRADVQLFVKLRYSAMRVSYCVKAR